MPKRYWTFSEGIHIQRSTNCIAAEPRSKFKSSVSEAASATPAATKLTVWMARTFSLGVISTIKAPTRGDQTIRLSIRVLLLGLARQDQGRGEA